MSSEQNSLKQEAEWLRVCLEQSFVSRSEIIAWAERRLELTDNPDPNVSDVALAVSTPLQDLIGLLGAFPGKADRNEIVGRFLAEVARRVRVDPGLLGRIPQILATLVSDDDGLNKEMAKHAKRFENDLELVEYAGTNVDDLRRRVLAFLDANSTPPNKALNPTGADAPAG